MAKIGEKVLTDDGIAEVQAVDSDGSPTALNLIEPNQDFNDRRTQLNADLNIFRVEKEEILSAAGETEAAENEQAAIDAATQAQTDLMKRIQDEKLKG